MRGRGGALALSLLLAACQGGSSGPISAEARREAQTIWDERCVNCHGPKGMGDGPGALVLDVRPRVLADSGWQRQVSDDRIASAIVDGGRAVGVTDRMPPNADLRRKPEVVRALVEIVRAL